MTDPTVLYAARRMPPRGGGGLERLSADTLSVLRESFAVEDFSHRGARLNELPYVATLAGRLRRAARHHAAAVADGSDASLAPALARSGVAATCRVVGLDLVHRNPLYRRVVHKALPRLNAIVAISKATARLLPATVDPERVHVVHPFAEAPKGFRRRAEGRRVLVIGRLVARKDIVGFVRDVWPLVLARDTDAQLDIVGDGPQRRALAQALRSIERPERVKWHGRATQPKLESLFARASVLAMNNRHIPSDFEGFGMVAIEAAVRGVPVVARAVDGIPDAVVAGRTGLLVKSRRPKVMAHAVARILDGEGPSSSTVREEARARFGRPRFKRQYEALVRSAMV